MNLLDYLNFLPNANVGCLRYKQINKGKRSGKKAPNEFCTFSYKYAIDSMNLFRSISQPVKPKVLGSRKQWVKIKMK